MVQEPSPHQKSKGHSHRLENTLGCKPLLRREQKRYSEHEHMKNNLPSILLVVVLFGAVSHPGYAAVPEWFGQESGLETWSFAGSLPLGSQLSDILSDGGDLATAWGNLNQELESGIAQEGSPRSSAPTRGIHSIGPRFDVTEFGAPGTGYHTTGTINISTNAHLMIVGASDGFDPGQKYVIPGAGASGEKLLITVTAVSGKSITFTPDASTSVNDVTIDDTLGIQAAFDRCYHGNVYPRGGVVEFPGKGTYSISGTINAYDSCQILGSLPGAGRGTRGFGAGTISSIMWTGKTVPSATGFSAFQVSKNTTYHTASSPHSLQQSAVTIESTANPDLDSWMLITGCSTLEGQEVNNLVGQVAATSSKSFVLTASYPWHYPGSWTDSTCVATPINVAVALDSMARNEQLVENIMLQDSTKTCTSASMGVDLFFGSRVDSGTKMKNVWADGACPYFAEYFSSGGIDFDFSDGFRSDGPVQIAQVYIRTQSAFQMTSGSLSSAYATGGSNIMIDLADCSGGPTRFTLYNTTMEADESFLPGAGGVKFLDCPTIYNYPQLRVEYHNSGVACGTNALGSNCPQIVVSPPNDSAIIYCSDSSFVGASFRAGSTPPFVGIPSMKRYNITGVSGYGTEFCYSPNIRGFGYPPDKGSIGPSAAVAQFLTDFNFNQLWQYGIQASALLYSDSAFEALPNGTTLEAGQILAPPKNWVQASSANNRYALQAVTKAGTTGTPNLGQTMCSSTGYTLTCSAPSATITSTTCTATNLMKFDTTAVSTPWPAGQNVIVSGTAENWMNGATVSVLPGATNSSFTAYLECKPYSNSSDRGTALTSSTTDLGFGQHISFGAQTNTSIVSVNALDPAAVKILVSDNTGVVTTPAKLNYAAPALGKEIQLPTKASAPPTSGTISYSVGDFIENSNASPNGIAGWIAVGSGTSPTWAAIPLGNSDGRINSSQISGTTGSGACSDCNGTGSRTAQAWCTGRAAPSSTITMFGAGTSIASCTAQVGAETQAQLLMNASGSVNNLAVRCASAGLNGSSGVFSVWDLPSGSGMSGAGSGVNTGLTVKYGTTSANTTLFDSKHSFKYEKGDLLRIQFTTQAGETLGNCEASFNY
jgi:hypothetical protein